MPLAISLAFETRILVVFVYSLPVQICEPRLDVSGWNENCHPLIPLTSLIARFGTGALNLIYAGGNVPLVGIDHHNQCLADPVLPCSVIGKFLRVLPPHELLRRTSALRADFDPRRSLAPACSRKKPARERLVLTILTQNDDLHVPAHCSHPLAMTSDSLSPPSIAMSRDGRTVVTPELSRCRRSPRSPPR